jgi:hypothetical protein
MSSIDIKKTLKDGPNKVMKFTLLKRKEVYFRPDLYIQAATMLALQQKYGWELLNVENLWGIISFILGVTFVAIVFFIKYWSANFNMRFCYSKLADGDIEKATHVHIILTNRKQNTVKSYVVPKITAAVETKPGQLNTAYSCELNKKRLLYRPDKKTFVSMPFPIKETIGFYQSSCGNEDDQTIKKAELVWGSNKMEIPIPTFFEIY